MRRLNGGFKFTPWAHYISTRLGTKDDAQEIGDTRIWIGSLSVGMDEPFLESKGIRYVLTVARGMVSDVAVFEETMMREHAVLELKDDVTETLVDAALLEALKFLDEAMEQKYPVLVHCEKGISRSTAVVCAYLITRQPMTMASA